jgi:hypothetical protein
VWFKKSDYSEDDFAIGVPVFDNFGGLVTLAKAFGGLGRFLREKSPAG